MVLVELRPLFVFKKSPVLNEPEPAYVFDVDFGEIYKASPIFMTPALPILFTFIPPTIEGIDQPSFLLRNNVLYGDISPSVHLFQTQLIGEMHKLYHSPAKEEGTMAFNPFDFLNNNSTVLQSELEKYQGFFDNFFGGEFLNKELFEQWMSTSGLRNNQQKKETDTTRAIPMDLYQRQNDLLLIFEIPGLRNEKDVLLKVVGQTLIVEGDMIRSNIPLEGELLKSERKIGKFSKKVVIPVAFDSKKIHARYQRGLLEVRIPVIKSSHHEKVSIRFTDQ